MKNKTIIVKTNTGDLELYKKEIKKALNCNWNSLYFSKNEDEFLSLLSNDRVFTLTTLGDTAILDSRGILYRNDNQDEIRYLINDDELNQCVIGERNWFAILVERVIDEKSGVLTTVYEDNLKFTGSPATIEELQNEIMEISSRYLEELNQLVAAV